MASHQDTTDATELTSMSIRARNNASVNGDVDHLWLLRMRKSWEAGMRYQPNYYLNKPEALQTTSKIHGFMLGTGATILQSIASAIENTQQELVFITCFWAASSSLESLKTSLQRLSHRVIRDGRPKVKIFIGFSSLSLMQKLIQTSSPEGRLYSADEWVKKLGLLHSSQLPGLDITIKSIFVRPFSVMHPKFVIIDRKIAWLPSCNVSWETWFEGAVVLSGPIVEQFVTFWKEFWLIGQANWPDVADITTSSSDDPIIRAISSDLNTSVVHSTKASFLPSPHHPYALCVPFLMLTSRRSPPATPLTNYLLTAIQTAHSQIHIQTPNLTAFVVLHELLDACQNGIDVNITTSEQLMVLEQLVTAGTTTKKAVKWLMTKHRQLKRIANDDPEAHGNLGRLQISLFHNPQPSHVDEATQTHIKLTIIDQETVILGSQNLDRASWFTSQELGVAFQSREFAQQVQSQLDDAMRGKQRLIYDSHKS